MFSTKKGGLFRVEILSKVRERLEKSKIAMGLSSERMPREGCMVGLRRGWSGVQRRWSGVTSPKMGGREARTRPVTTPVRLPDFHIWCGWLVDFEEGPAGEGLASVWACANSTALCARPAPSVMALFAQAALSYSAAAPPIIGGWGDFKYQYMPDLLQAPPGAGIVE